MLPQDPAIEAAGMDAQLVGHQIAEAGRVQIGATADDAVFGQAAQLPGHVGQDVHCIGRRQPRVTNIARCAPTWMAWSSRWAGTWVGHHDEDAVRAVLDDLGDDVLEDVDVPLNKVQTTLSLLLPHAGRYHHDTRVGRHRVVCQKEALKREKQGQRAIPSSDQQKDCISASEPS